MVWGLLQHVCYDVIHLVVVMVMIVAKAVVCLVLVVVVVVAMASVVAMREVERKG